MLVAGGCLLVLCGGFIGLVLLVSGNRQGNPGAKEPTNADQPVDKDSQKNERGAKPTTGPKVGPPPIAPPPRLIPLNRSPEGFASEWVRHGGVRTRVTGACVTIPLLTDDTGREFPSDTACLLVWVESQNLNAIGVSLRRWISPLNEAATLTGADNVRLKPAKLPTGARVGGQLAGGHSLVPGGLGIVDVLAFEVPGAAARRLFIKLTGSHVAEGEDFNHVIPYEVWSQK